MPVKVAFISNIAPHYRSKLWYKLMSDPDFEYHFFFGKSRAGGIVNIDFSTEEWIPYNNRIHYLKNYWIKKFLVYQSHFRLSKFLRDYDVYIILGDMYILSNWLISIRFKLQKKRIIFWGHGFYGNEQFLKKILKKVFYRLADSFLVYGNYSKKLMVNEGYSYDSIHVIYNSLDYEKHLSLREKVVDNSYYRKKFFFKNSDLPVLVFIGRLTPQKKLDLLINAVKELIISGDLVNLIIVGSGPEENRLKEMASELADNIHFFGPCYDEEKIGFILANADLCVSPGNVGLTAIHSLSFGTPVCTHDNYLMQMPEFEAIKEGVTGTFYSYNKNNLVDTLKNWIHSIQNRNEIREACYKVIDEKYNPKYQVKIINAVVKHQSEK